MGEDDGVGDGDGVMTAGAAAVVKLAAAEEPEVPALLVTFALQLYSVLAERPARSKVAVVAPAETVAEPDHATAPPLVQLAAAPEIAAPPSEPKVTVRVAESWVTLLAATVGAAGAVATTGAAAVVKLAAAEEPEVPALLVTFALQLYSVLAERPRGRSAPSEPKVTVRVAESWVTLLAATVGAAGALYSVLAERPARSKVAVVAPAETVAEPDHATAPPLVQLAAAPEIAAPPSEPKVTVRVAESWVTLLAATVGAAGAVATTGAAAVVKLAAAEEPEVPALFVTFALQLYSVLAERPARSKVAVVAPAETVAEPDHATAPPLVQLAAAPEIAAPPSEPKVTVRVAESWVTLLAATVGAAGAVATTGAAAVVKLAAAEELEVPALFVTFALQLYSVLAERPARSKVAVVAPAETVAEPDHATAPPLVQLAAAPEIAAPPSEPKVTVRVAESWVTLLAATVGAAGAVDVVVKLAAAEEPEVPALLVTFALQLYSVLAERPARSKVAVVAPAETVAEPDHATAPPLVQLAAAPEIAAPPSEPKVTVRVAESWVTLLAATVGAAGAVATTGAAAVVKLAAAEEPEVPALFVTFALQLYSVLAERPARSKVAVVAPAETVAEPDHATAPPLVQLAAAPEIAAPPSEPKVTVRVAESWVTLLAATVGAAGAVATTGAAAVVKLAAAEEPEVPALFVTFALQLYSVLAERPARSKVAVVAPAETVAEPDHATAPPLVQLAAAPEIAAPPSKPKVTVRVAESWVTLLAATVGAAGAVATTGAAAVVKLAAAEEPEVPALFVTFALQLYSVLAERPARSKVAVVAPAETVAEPDHATAPPLVQLAAAPEIAAPPSEPKVTVRVAESWVTLLAATVGAAGAVATTGAAAVVKLAAAEEPEVPALFVTFALQLYSVLAERPARSKVAVVAPAETVAEPDHATAPPLVQLAAAPEIAAPPSEPKVTVRVAESWVTLLAATVGAAGAVATTGAAAVVKLAAAEEPEVPALFVTFALQLYSVLAERPARSKVAVVAPAETVAEPDHATAPPLVQLAAAPEIAAPPSEPKVTVRVAESWVTLLAATLAAAEEPEVPALFVTFALQLYSVLAERPARSKVAVVAPAETVAEPDHATAPPLVQLAAAPEIAAPPSEPKVTVRVAESWVTLLAATEPEVPALLVTFALQLYSVLAERPARSKVAVVAPAETVAEPDHATAPPLVQLAAAPEIAAPPSEPKVTVRVAESWVTLLAATVGAAGALATTGAAAVVKLAAAEELEVPALLVTFALQLYSVLAERPARSKVAVVAPAETVAEPDHATAPPLVQLAAAPEIAAPPSEPKVTVRVAESWVTLLAATVGAAGAVATTGAAAVVKLAAAEELEVPALFVTFALQLYSVLAERPARSKVAVVAPAETVAEPDHATAPPLVQLAAAPEIAAPPSEPKVTVRVAESWLAAAEEPEVPALFVTFALQLYSVLAERPARSKVAVVAPAETVAEPTTRRRRHSCSWPRRRRSQRPVRAEGHRQGRGVVGDAAGGDGWGRRSGGDDGAAAVVKLAAAEEPEVPALFVTFALQLYSVLAERPARSKVAVVAPAETVAEPDHATAPPLVQLAAAPEIAAPPSEPKVTVRVAESWVTLLAATVGAAGAVDVVVKLAAAEEPEVPALLVTFALQLYSVLAERPARSKVAVVAPAETVAEPDHATAPPLVQLAAAPEIAAPPSEPKVTVRVAESWVTLLAATVGAAGALATTGAAAVVKLAAAEELEVPALFVTFALQLYSVLAERPARSKVAVVAPAETVAEPDHATAPPLVQLAAAPEIAAPPSEPKVTVRVAESWVTLLAATVGAAGAVATTGAAAVVKLAAAEELEVPALFVTFALQLYSVLAERPARSKVAVVAPAETVAEPDHATAPPLVQLAAAPEIAAPPSEPKVTVRVAESWVTLLAATVGAAGALATTGAAAVVKLAAAEELEVPALLVTFALQLYSVLAERPARSKVAVVAPAETVAEPDHATAPPLVQLAAAPEIAAPPSEPKVTVRVAESWVTLLAATVGAAGAVATTGAAAVVKLAAAEELEVPALFVTFALQLYSVLAERPARSKVAVVAPAETVAEPDHATAPPLVQLAAAPEIAAPPSEPKVTVRVAESWVTLLAATVGAAGAVATTGAAAVVKLAAAEEPEVPALFVTFALQLYSVLAERPARSKVAVVAPAETVAEPDHATAPPLVQLAAAPEIAAPPSEPKVTVRVAESWVTLLAATVGAAGAVATTGAAAVVKLAAAEEPEVPALFVTFALQLYSVLAERPARSKVAVVAPAETVAEPDHATAPPLVQLAAAPEIAAPPSEPKLYSVLAERPARSKVAVVAPAETVAEPDHATAPPLVQLAAAPEIAAPPVLRAGREARESKVAVVAPAETVAEPDHATAPPLVQLAAAPEIAAPRPSRSHRQGRGVLAAAEELEVPALFVTFALQLYSVLAERPARSKVAVVAPAETVAEPDHATAPPLVQLAAAPEIAAPPSEPKVTVRVAESWVTLLAATVGAAGALYSVLAERPARSKVAVVAPAETVAEPDHATAPPLVQLAAAPEIAAPPSEPKVTVRVAESWVTLLAATLAAAEEPEVPALFVTFALQLYSVLAERPARSKVAVVAPAETVAEPDHATAPPLVQLAAAPEIAAPPSEPKVTVRVAESWVTLLAATVGAAGAVATTGAAAVVKLAAAEEPSAPSEPKVTVRVAESWVTLLAATVGAAGALYSVLAERPARSKVAVVAPAETVAEPDHATAPPLVQLAAAPEIAAPPVLRAGREAREVKLAAAPEIAAPPSEPKVTVRVAESWVTLLAATVGAAGALYSVLAERPARSKVAVVAPAETVAEPDHATAPPLVQLAAAPEIAAPRPSRSLRRRGAEVPALFVTFALQLYSVLAERPARSKVAVVAPAETVAEPDHATAPPLVQLAAAPEIAAPPSEPKVTVRVAESWVTLLAATVGAAGAVATTGAAAVVKLAAAEEPEVPALFVTFALQLYSVLAERPARSKVAVVAPAETVTVRVAESWVTLLAATVGAAGAVATTGAAAVVKLAAAEEPEVPALLVTFALQLYSVLAERPARSKVAVVAPAETVTVRVAESWVTLLAATVRAAGAVATTGAAAVVKLAAAEEPEVPALFVTFALQLYSVLAERPARSKVAVVAPAETVAEPDHATAPPLVQLAAAPEIAAPPSEPKVTVRVAESWVTLLAATVGAAGAVATTGAAAVVKLAAAEEPEVPALLVTFALQLYSVLAERPRGRSWPRRRRSQRPSEPKVTVRVAESWLAAAEELEVPALFVTFAPQLYSVLAERPVRLKVAVVAPAETVAEPDHAKALPLVQLAAAPEIAAPPSEPKVTVRVAESWVTLLAATVRAAGAVATTGAAAVVKLAAAEEPEVPALLVTFALQLYSVLAERPARSKVAVVAPAETVAEPDHATAPPLVQLAAAPEIAAPPSEPEVTVRVAESWVTLLAATVGAAGAVDVVVKLAAAEELEVPALFVTFALQLYSVLAERPVRLKVAVVAPAETVAEPDHATAPPLVQLAAAPEIAAPPSEPKVTVRVAESWVTLLAATVGAAGAVDVVVKLAAAEEPEVPALFVTFALQLYSVLAERPARLKVAVVAPTETVAEPDHATAPPLVQLAAAPEIAAPPSEPKVTVRVAESWVTLLAATVGAAGAVDVVVKLAAAEEPEVPALFVTFALQLYSVLAERPARLKVAVVAPAETVAEPDHATAPPLVQLAAAPEIAAPPSEPKVTVRVAESWVTLLAATVGAAGAVATTGAAAVVKLAAAEELEVPALFVTFALQLYSVLAERPARSKVAVVAPAETVAEPDHATAPPLVQLAAAPEIAAPPSEPKVTVRVAESWVTLLAATVGAAGAVDVVVKLAAAEEPEVPALFVTFALQLYSVLAERPARLKVAVVAPAETVAEPDHATAPPLVQLAAAPEIAAPRPSEVTVRSRIVACGGRSRAGRGAGDRSAPSEPKVTVRVAESWVTLLAATVGAAGAVDVVVKLAAAEEPEVPALFVTFALQLYSVLAERPARSKVAVVAPAETVAEPDHATALPLVQLAAAPEIAAPPSEPKVTVRVAESWVTLLAATVGAAGAVATTGAAAVVKLAAAEEPEVPALFVTFALQLYSVLAERPATSKVAVVAPAETVAEPDHATAPPLVQLAAAPEIAAPPSEPKVTVRVAESWVTLLAAKVGAAGAVATAGAAAVVKLAAAEELEVPALL
eukprot:tig00000523_g1871.t1